MRKICKCPALGYAVNKKSKTPALCYSAGNEYTIFCVEMMQENVVTSYKIKKKMVF